MKEWNAQKRKECKRKCKAHVAAHLGSCIGANVLYSLPIILLMLIVYLTMFGSSFALLVAGADESAVAQAMLRGTGSGLFTAVLLLLVVSGPLTFGLMRFYTDLTRGGRPGAGAVLQPITSGASLWTGIRMSFCLFLRSLMWTVPPTVLLTIGAVAVSAMSFMTGSTDSMTGGLIALYVVYGLVSFLINIKLMTYSAGWVVLHDNEQYGVWNATRDASAVFRGRFGALLIFELSFLGWNLLALASVYLCFLLGMLGLTGDRRRPRHCSHGSVSDCGALRRPRRRQLCKQLLPDLVHRHVRSSRDSRAAADALRLGADRRFRAD